MQDLGNTTELDSVNIMLSDIGESPISSLTAEQNSVDVVVALQILREITIQVQKTGWHFNTEVQWELSPSASGEIFVPSNCVQMDTSGNSASFDLTVRGGRVYDRLNHTYLFTGSITVDMVVLLPFDQIPEAARHYITIRAARVFQQRVLGSVILGSFTQRDEAVARAGLHKMDANTADYNILSGSWSVARVLQR